jgi:hypothetical protein
MDVYDGIEFFIGENREHYDGLCNEDCACDFENLVPCGDMRGDCTLGYQVPCDCGDHDFHIVAGKNKMGNKTGAILFIAALFNLEPQQLLLAS